MEIQILDSTAPKYKDLKDYQFHGGLYTMAPAKQGFLKPVGEWNQERVTVMGPTLKVELNGEIILRANLDDMARLHPEHQGVKRRAGHIGWLGHGDKVSFRNINIAEMPPVANEDGVKAAGFTKIFDGKTLNGWKHTPDTTNWIAVNGILKHNGKAGPVKDLWTEKSYKDFTLVCDWRWCGRGPTDGAPESSDPTAPKSGILEIEELDSGIYLRGNSKSQVNLWNWTVGSGEVYGYRTDPKMPADVKAGVTPKSKADKPLGEWNRMMITLKGDRLTVSLNGEIRHRKRAPSGHSRERPHRPPAPRQPDRIRQHLGARGVIPGTRFFPRSRDSLRWGKRYAAGLPHPPHDPQPPPQGCELPRHDTARTHDRPSSSCSASFPSSSFVPALGNAAATAPRASSRCATCRWRRAPTKTFTAMIMAAARSPKTAPGTLPESFTTRATSDGNSSPKPRASTTVRPAAPTRASCPTFFHNPANST